MTTITTGMVISQAHTHLLCIHFRPLDPCTNRRWFFISLLPSLSYLQFLQFCQSRDK